MKTYAYSPFYLSKASRVLGNMLHYAILVYGMDGTDFWKRFIQSTIAEEFENGNPKYISGRSGVELFAEVMERTTGVTPKIEQIETYERSDVYWVGWMLAHYQWHSGRSFKTILETVPYEEVLGLYDTLHEADIQKSFEVMELHFDDSESRLRRLRKYCELTQGELAEKSGVSINTIRAYEQKNKELNKASMDIVLRLSKALKCDVTELVE